MAPTTLLPTIALLGAFALAGGAYAVLYAAGRHQQRATYLRAGYAAFLLQAATAAATVVATPLDAGWKAAIVLSCGAYALIPPLVLRSLEHLHHDDAGAA